MEFLGTLKIPEEKMSGQPLRLAEFQRRFVCSAMADGVMVGVLSIGRGNANLNRNERISTEDRSVLVTVDEWLSAEVIGEAVALTWEDVVTGDGVAHNDAHGVADEGAGCAAAGVLAVTIGAGWITS